MLEKNLRGQGSAAAARAAMSLHLLSNWHAMHGSLAILNDDITGWAELDRVLHYRWWKIRITTSMTLVQGASRCVAHAIAFHEFHMADWLATRLVTSLDDLAFQTWEVSRFGVFLLRLWAMYTRREIVLERPKIAELGIYQRVFDGWSDDDALRVAIREMCDYHLEQSFDSHGYPEFTETPYELFPIDVLALEVIRKQMGLSTPRPDHPLLATPLANPPPRERRPRMGPDPLLQRVIAKAKEAGLLPPEEV